MAYSESPEYRKRFFPEEYFQSLGPFQRAPPLVITLTYSHYYLGCNIDLNTNVHSVAVNASHSLKYDAFNSGFAKSC
jgi:hypothetical protein